MKRLGAVVLWLLVVGSVFADPVISEFMASNDTVLMDEDGDYPDWIELHNPDAVAVDLDGWYLTDDVAEKTKWAFPSVTIQPGGYLIVFASDKDRAVQGSELHTNFKLSAAGEYLALVKPDGSTTAAEFNPFPGQQTDVSYGLLQVAEVVNTVVGEGGALRYHVPTGPVANWNENVFDDAAWSQGASGIGYERGSGYEPVINTDIENAVYGVNQTVYLRLSFSVADPTAVTSLLFSAKWDDGFAAYLNGQLITSDNAPATLSWNSGANSSQEADLSSYQSWDASSLITHLVAGTNTLAIQMLNRFSTSSDFLMIPQLDITTVFTPPAGQYDYFTQPTPGAENNSPAGEPSGVVQISEPSGVKTAAINVDLIAPTPDAVIRYTLDGSEPTESSAAYNGTALSISDPSRLRVRAFEPGKVAGPVSAADYSFIDASLLGYLSDVPVIVMDNFGAGSYPNKGRTPDGNGIVQVPRQSNVMSFFDTSSGNQPFSQAPVLESRAGCRVRGSSSSTFPRKPLSVEFWEENANEDRNLSPFGMEAEADWVLYPPNPSFDRSLIHNPVAFGFAEMIGALHPASKIVVVFQNTGGGKVTGSDMEGVYVFMEKVERNRMGMDFDKMDDTGTTGGWSINVDRLEAIPVGMPSSTVQPNFHAAGPNGVLEIPDDVGGDSSPQSEDDISTFYHSFLNFHSPDGYDILQDQRAEIQSRVRAMDAAVWSNNFDDPVSGYAAHVDVDSWARFYAAHNFAKNNDAIVLSTYLYQPSPDDKIRMGPVWDVDRAFTQNGSATSSPLYVSNRDWYGGIFQDINFQQAHQDIWQEARRTTATDSALQALVDDAATGLRADQVSASGLSFSSWQNRVDDMRDWVVDRANYIDSQFEPLPTVSPATEQFTGSLSISMSPASGGVVYYTTDGTDPRLPGGGISPAASAFAPFSISQRTRIIARTKDGSDWSGKIEKNYYRLADLPQLVVSEIGYHPADPTAAEIAQGYDNADDFEYLEVMNIGTGSADLSNLVLAGGIAFNFASGAISDLAAGARVIIVRNMAAFEFRHGSGLPVAGEYEGALNNAGDTIILRDQFVDVTHQHFGYDDEAPWPVCADGDGYSLILKQPFTDPEHGLASSWRCSALPTGNPGTSDALPAFSGNAAEDLDGDGLSALIEHFLGTDDNDSTLGNDRLVIGTTVSDSGEIYPTFSVRYAVGADDVVPELFWSDDLVGWSSTDADVLLHSYVWHGDGTATYTWRSTYQVNSTAQFFRLKIHQP